MKDWRNYIESIIGLYHPFIKQVNKILHEEKSSKGAVFAMKSLIYELEAKMLKANEDFLSRNVFLIQRVKKIPNTEVTGVAGNVKFTYSLN